MCNEQSVKKVLFLYVFVGSGLLFMINGCKKEPYGPGMASRPRVEAEERVEIGELDFLVQNTTGKPIFATCFYYAKKATGYRWRWYKSPVYRLEHNRRALVDIDTIPEPQHKKDIYGYLAIFNDRTEAETAIYELLEDEKRIDIGLLIDIHDKMIVVEKDTYGFKGEILDFDVKKFPETFVVPPTPELDFIVENKTDQDWWVTCFVYQKTTKYHPQWDFVKTPVQRLEDGKRILIDIETILKDYNRENVRGFLAIFPTKEDAESSIYELVPHYGNLKIGRLKKLRGKKIVIWKQPYGLSVDRKHKPSYAFIEFSIEPHEKGLTRLDVER